jgi:hypothetical protein
LFCGGFSLVGNVAGSSAAEITVREGNKTTTRIYDTREEMEREAPGYKNFMLLNGVAGVALALAMLTGSLGLLFTKAWSWWLTLLWCLGNIAFQIGTAAYLWTVAMPACNRMVKVVPRDEGGLCNGLVNGNTFYHLGWAIFASGFWIYQALILILLVIPVTRRACLGGAETRRSSRDDDEDERRQWDEEDDRPRRRRRDRDDD